MLSAAGPRPPHLQAGLLQRKLCELVDISRRVSHAWHEHVAQPEGDALRLELCSKAQRALLLEAGQVGVALRVEAFDAEQHHVGHRQHLVPAGMVQGRDKTYGITPPVSCVLCC